MENWIEADVLEKDIILCVHKKPKSITEISKKVKRAKSTISESVKRLLKQEIVTKNCDYKEDARKNEISINQKRIKIEKTHTFYLIYFILTFFSFILSGILSYFLKNLFLFIGSSIGIILPLLFILYEAYIKGDKILVYKSPKIIKKENKNS